MTEPAAAASSAGYSAPPSEAAAIPASPTFTFDFGSKPLVFVVTGANRGLGLQFVRDIVSDATGHKVIALVRTPGSEQLSSLDRVQEVQCDVSDSESIKNAGLNVSKLVDHIDVLINNAGVIGPGIEAFEEMTKEGMLETYNVNVVGTMLVTQELLPLLRKAEGLPKIALLSSGLSSNLATRKMGNTLTSYACSKAAINMLVTQMAVGMKDIATIGLGPGWCDTDLGKSVGAPPHRGEVTIPGCLNVLSTLTLEQSGKFISFDGKEMPY